MKGFSIVMPRPPEIAPITNEPSSMTIEPLSAISRNMPGAAPLRPDAPAIASAAKMAGVSIAAATAGKKTLVGNGQLRQHARHGGEGHGGDRTVMAGDGGRVDRRHARRRAQERRRRRAGRTESTPAPMVVASGRVSP